MHQRAESASEQLVARYYCPWLGRWTTADPLGLQAGINVYLYCRAGPVTLSDPSGLDDAAAQAFSGLERSVNFAIDFLFKKAQGVQEAIAAYVDQNEQTLPKWKLDPETGTYFDARPSEQPKRFDDMSPIFTNNQTGVLGKLIDARNFFNEHIPLYRGLDDIKQSFLTDDPLAGGRQLGNGLIGVGETATMFAIPEIPGKPTLRLGPMTPSFVTPQGMVMGGGGALTIDITAVGGGIVLTLPGGKAPPKKQKPVVPPREDQGIPDPPGPYANLPDPPGVAQEAKFTPEQIEEIYAENRRRNGGILKSDDPNDPVQGELVRMGKAVGGQQLPDNGAAIDHIIPRSLGGSNSYKNARVTSWKSNSNKSNKP